MRAPARPGRPPADRHRPGQGHGERWRRPTTTPPASRRSSTATSCSVINCQPRGDLDPDGSITSPSTTSTRGGSRCGCARARRTSARIDALGMEVDFERGEEIRTEISCKFTRAAGARVRGRRARADRLVHGRRRPVRAVAAGPVASRAGGIARITLERLYPTRGVARGRARPTATLGLAERALRRTGPTSIANMVATADGRATLAAAAADLAARPTGELFLNLRTQVDAVMAGTATIAIEGYGPLVKSAGAARAARGARGLEPVPLAVHRQPHAWSCRCRRRCSRIRSSRIVVLTNSEREPPPCDAHADRRAHRRRRRSTSSPGWSGCARRTGCARCCSRAGRRCSRAMTAAGAGGRAFLTVSPKLVGSADEPSILEGPALRNRVELELRLGCSRRELSVPALPARAR